MASRNTHILIGVGLSLTSYGIYKWRRKENWTLKGTCGSLILGVVAGILPDILEPSLNNPNHRAFFHSAGFAVLLLLSKKWVNENPNFAESQKLMFNSFVNTYISHLGADVRTPQGLPWL